MLLTTGLNAILEKLKHEKQSVAAKREAQELLSRLDPQELVIVEEKLARAGLHPEDLRSLCSAHMSAAAGRVDQLKQSLQAGHVLHTMICEHEKILEYLESLEKTNEKVQRACSWEEVGNEISLLKNIAHHLISAEKHHQREEQVLFKALLEKGVAGPPQVMTAEHVELRARKERLAGLLGKSAVGSFDEFKEALNAVSGFLVLSLRDHIFKENNILYPMATSVLSNPTEWAELKKKCDEIGYCCFSPLA